jgi:hypothetical protein
MCYWEANLGERALQPLREYIGLRPDHSMVKE